MTRLETIRVLAELPNYSEVNHGLAPADMAWLTDIRLRIAHAGATVTDDEGCRLLGLLEQTATILEDDQW